MLRDAIEKCPEDLWYNRDQVNAVWQVAYHTLFFVHLYTCRTEAEFEPWTHHQANVQHPDGMTGPPDPTSTLPLIPEPYTKALVLEYWDFCDSRMDEALDSLDVMAAKAGISWKTMSMLEHHIGNIRHIQIGATQIGARLRATLNIGVDWVGSRALKQSI
jgi:hypothetical protein